MLETVRQYIQANRMINPGDRVIVSVSGGPDSVALLHVLKSLSSDLQCRIHVFHLDHGLRGEESAGDARFVRRLADDWGLESTVIGLGPGTLRNRGGSLQAAARAARMEEIDALARRIGATRVAIGHTADDQAETVLIRLLRGAGPHGLAGIHPVRRIGQLTFVRPLLEVSRQDVERYCDTYELFPRLDPSNLKPDYLRNRIRLQLLPMLAREYNPAVRANLAQLAEITRVESDYLDLLATEALARCISAGDGVAISGSALLAQPLAIARRVVRLAAKAVGGPEIELGLGSVSRVLDLAARSEGTHTLFLPGSLRAVVEYGICRFSLDDQKQASPASAHWPVAQNGETLIPELGLKLKAGRGGTYGGPFEAAFDADQLPGPLAIRFRRPGDRIWPVGMEGSKKLQDILVDAKVPRFQRDRLPILVSGGEVLWVIGYRLDRRFLAMPSTSNPLHLRAESMPR